MSTIHLITHTHWDREWYLTFQQFRLKLVRLIDHLLEIFEQDPDFRYFLLDGQAILLEDYFQIRPENRPFLLKLIRDGRISIGPWYISPDEFLVGPEAHVRNLLEGSRLCEEYGKKMLVGYLPDTFGHIGQMPQILQGFGITCAAVWRGLGDQPCELLWESPDGSSVLLAYMRESYSNGASLTTSDPEKFAQQVQELSAVLSPYSPSGHILLMHGTDHMEPPSDLGAALRAYSSGGYPDKLLHSTLPYYIADIQAALHYQLHGLPEVIGELRSSKRTPLVPNVLSTRMWIKQRNHHCEDELIKWVEPLSAWLSLLDETSPGPTQVQNQPMRPLSDLRSIIRNAWKILLQCHPHDSICGTSIDQVAKEMSVRFDQVDQITRELVTQNLEKLSSKVNTLPDQISSSSGAVQNILSSIVVFNPSDYKTSGLVNLVVKIDKPYTSFEIIDSTGSKLPFHQSGAGHQDLISMVLDKKSFKQAFGMVHEGKFAGMVVRDFEIKQEISSAIIQVTLSNHGEVDLTAWKKGVAEVEKIIADPTIKEFFIRASSDPETSLSFIASEVPGHGYRSFWIRGFRDTSYKQDKPIKLNPILKAVIPVINNLSHLPIVNWVSRDKKPKSSRPPYRIENEYFIVEATPVDGVLSITDKQTSQVYHGQNRFQDGGDGGDVYNYNPPQADQLVNARLIKVETIRNEIQQKLILHFRMTTPGRISEDRKSRSREHVTTNIRSEIIVSSGVARIDICTDIDNQAQDHRLRVHFPAPFTCSSSWHAGHYEIVERPIGIPQYDESWEEPPRPEVPQREFTRISDGVSSLTIANRGLPEVQVFINEQGNAEIALTLLRCIGWLSRDDISTRKGHAGPMGIATPDAQMQGKFKAGYSIIPGGSDWRAALLQAHAFNSPMYAIQSTLHNGLLPDSSAMIENSAEAFWITAIKMAEIGSGLIVRGFNISSSPIEVTLKPWKPFKFAQFVTLNEEVISEISPTDSSEVKFRLEGNKIATIRLSD